ncbi:MAG: FliG C-terminal domain-containing protein [Phycisphaerae bacterium]
MIGKDSVKEVVGLVRTRLAGLSRRARWIAAIAAGAVLFAALWATVAGFGNQRVPLDTTGLNAADLATARRMLADSGISSRLTDGRLMVRAKQLAAATEIIAPLAQRPEDAAESLAALAKEDDIWRTTAQSDKRWQAAKMAALSRLVEKFPAVASATVLYEPGSPRGLGGAGHEPTAAVRVTMKPGATLNRSMALAIADLVAGSIADMSDRNVRVIDGSGRSYRFDAESGDEKELQRRCSIETYYHEKVHAALSYIDKVVIGVTATGKDDPAAALAVSVAVPRSYLVAVARSNAADPSAADKVLDKIRQAAQAAVADRPCQVKADWYYDAEADALAAAALSPSGAFGWGSLLMAVLVSSVAGGGAVLLAKRVTLRRASRGAKEQDISANPQAAESGSPVSPQEGPWDFLAHLSSEEIASLVAYEHPQTVAIVLGQLAPAAAAAVLAALSEETQAAVARRVAVLHQVDPVVIAEVARTLAQRAARQAAGGPSAAGPEGHLAEILRHAGYATEKAVLEALAERAPSLVEAIHRRMFSFEDIAQLPLDRLQQALAPVDAAELAVALRTAGEDVKAKVFGALSSETRRKVREEMERMGPVRLSEVEAAQQRVAEAVRRAGSGEYLSESARQEKQLLA